MLGSLTDKLAWRYRFLRSTPHLTLAERLSVVLPKVGSRDLRTTMAGRLRRNERGTPYFEIGGDRVFFLPEGEVADEAAAIEGALVIMEEAYGGPSDFFWPPVDTRPGDVVLDLGGNFGTSALKLARRVGPSGRVYSFEPVFHEPLRRTLDANGIGNARVVPRAVGDRCGEVDFAVTGMGIDSRMASDSSPDRRSVPITTIDRFVAEAGLERVDFIKSDIEGAEELAIRGARETIERFRPKWTIASYHTDPEGDRQHAKLVRLLSRLGYTVREVGGSHIYAH